MARRHGNGGIRYLLLELGGCLGLGDRDLEPLDFRLQFNHLGIALANRCLPRRYLGLPLRKARLHALGGARRRGWKKEDTQLSDTTEI